ncbi:MAG: ABC transporter ATP-binding protein [Anaerolineae bacterium]|jgi:sulfate transport system ATP-binding protein|nr:ABC transporter ATP-binding protein [Anaerolineae bacterium]
MSINLTNIHKGYGAQVVVDDVSLEIESGELFVLLGPSGSGKSTILRLIAGLTPLDQGGIALHGRDVSLLPPQQRGVGFVFQNYSLFQHMTAEQNIAFGLEVKRVPRSERQARVTELLQLIEMETMGKRYPHQLSGGQQQRVAVARALAQRPEVLLLDEPFGALDVKIRAQLRQNLRAIQTQLGVTTILVTHDQEEAFELADRIGVIDGGKLLEVGTPDQLYRAPKHRFTATFLGNANLFPAHRNGSKVYLGDQHLPAPPDTDHLTGQPVEMMLRPESIEIALNPTDLKGSVLGQATVTQLAFAGALERVTVQLEDRVLQVLIHPAQSRQLGIRPGDRIWLGVQEYHLLATNHHSGAG